jgi:hypothetical protein
MLELRTSNQNVWRKLLEMIYKVDVVGVSMDRFIIIKHAKMAA